MICIDINRLVSQTSWRMSEAENQVNDYLSRPARYGNIDGMGEIGGGLFALGMALIFLLPGNKMVFLIILMAVIHYGTKAFRNRVTYRRTGFVVPRIEKSVKRTSAASAAVIAIMIVVGLSQRSVSLPLVFAGCLLFAYGIIAVRFGPLYRNWWALGAMAAGLIILGLLPPPFFESLFPGEGRFGSYLLSIGYVGAVMLVSGVITLTLYLKRTKPAGAEMDSE
jgi:multisubunit Na+/H+ antiporter MnhC subunit